MMGAKAKAKSTNQYFQLITSILFLCLVSSSARLLLTDDMYSQSLAAEKDSTVRPCSGGEETGLYGNYKKYQMKEAPDHPATQLGKVGGIFGALVMNVLPKGTTPPSGPSRRNNAIQT